MSGSGGPGSRARDKWGPSLRRILAVARKEFLQISRDALLLGFIAGVPLAQLLLFGYAINQDIRQVPTAVVDRAGTSVSRQLLGELEATQTFRITRYATTEEEARALLDRGAVQAAIVIPDDFSRAYYRGRGAEVLILVDATDPIRARAVRAAANGLAAELEGRFQQFGAGGARRSSTRDAGRFEVRPELIHERGIQLSVLTLFNPELRTPVYVVPGLLGVILTTTMILMTSLSLVRERERGTFEFLIGTPVRRAELMVGKIAPFVVIGLGQVAIVVLAGLAFFRVPIQGSVLDLTIGSLLFIAANLTLGLVISSITRTQAQATHLSFFFFLPSVLLSGFMFPFAAMPVPAQWLGELLPLTHYIRICRAILLRGASIWQLPGSLLALTLFIAAGLFAATRLFRKQLD